jgi:hypothetical protein
MAPALKADSKTLASSDVGKTLQEECSVTRLPQTPKKVPSLSSSCLEG